MLRLHLLLPLRLPMPLMSPVLLISPVLLKSLLQLMYRRSLLSSPDLPYLLLLRRHRHPTQMSLPPEIPPWLFYLYQFLYIQLAMQLCHRCHQWVELVLHPAANWACHQSTLTSHFVLLLCLSFLCHLSRTRWQILRHHKRVSACFPVSPPLLLTHMVHPQTPVLCSSSRCR